MQVPLLDLKAQYAIIREEIIPAVQAVLESQIFNIGPAVKELEKTIADYCGCKAAVGVSSGTDALLVSLMALGIGPGDEVITTPFTFFATAGGIWRVGARPVFVDIDPETFNIAPAGIEAAVTEKTKALLPVHLFGQMAEMEAIMPIAERHGLAVIEDAAQAIGASRNGRMAGSMGTMGCLSFYATKTLGAFGDGGMVVTQDAELAERLEKIRNHGQGGSYVHEFIGGNFRLDNLQAAVLGVKMRHLADWLDRRQAIGRRYGELLADCAEVVTPIIHPPNVSSFNYYVIRAQRRDELRAFLTDRGIGTSIYYQLCLHEQECFASLGYRRGQFPHAEQAAGEVLALPVYPEMADEQIAVVAEGIKSFYA